MALSSSCRLLEFSHDFSNIFPCLLPLLVSVLHEVYFQLVVKLKNVRDALHVSISLLYVAIRNLTTVKSLMQGDKVERGRVILHASDSRFKTFISMVTYADLQRNQIGED